MVIGYSVVTREHLSSELFDGLHLRRSALVAERRLDNLPENWTRRPLGFRVQVSWLLWH